MLLAGCSIGARMDNGRRRRPVAGAGESKRSKGYGTAGGKSRMGGGRAERSAVTGWRSEGRQQCWHPWWSAAHQLFEEWSRV